MYSSTSNSYWKERQNKTNRSPTLVVASLVVIALAIGTLLHRRHSSSQYNNDILTQRRTMEETTDEHWRMCESRVNSKKECTTICQPERNSIQRNTMHQACLQESVLSCECLCSLCSVGDLATSFDLHLPLLTAFASRMY